MRVIIGTVDVGVGVVEEAEAGSWSTPLMCVPLRCCDRGDNFRVVVGLRGVKFES